MYEYIHKYKKKKESGRKGLHIVYTPLKKKKKKKKKYIE